MANDPTTGPASSGPSSSGPSSSGPSSSGPTNKGPSGKKLQIVVDKHDVCKIQVPSGMDVRKEWDKFVQAHSAVSDKKGCFPTMFVGDLVQAGAVQLDKNSSVDGKEEFHVHP